MKLRYLSLMHPVQIGIRFGFVAFFLVFGLFILESCSRAELPTVRTTSAFDADISSFKVLGEVVSDGGEPILSRGFVYSTRPGPTLIDFYTTEGTGSGVFLSEITNLFQARTYYVRAYATNAVGTAYGDELEIFTERFLLGDTLDGGIIAYILQPTDSGYVPGRTKGLLVAPQDLSDGVWGCLGIDVVGTSSAFGAGPENTNRIVSECSDPNAAAALCDALSIQGFSDWYLPSREELKAISQNKFVIGGFQNKKYWSSSQITINSAWVIDFVTDFEFGEVKSETHAIRPIKSF